MGDAPDPTTTTTPTPGPTVGPQLGNPESKGQLTVPDKAGTPGDGNTPANAPGQYHSTIPWGRWALRLLGKVGRKAVRYADLLIPDNGATLDDRVPRDDYEQSIQKQGEEAIKKGEDSWEVQKWYHKSIDEHREQNVHVNKCPSKVLNGITMKQKKIRPLAGDSTTRYGHHWTELGPDESYGWYPDMDGMGKAQQGYGTAFGCPGVLNGTPKEREELGRGSDTQDPHHADKTTDDQFHPKTEDGDCRTEDEVKECLRKFFQQYQGNWSWPRGPNCHTLQEDAMEHCKVTRAGSRNVS